MGDLYRITKDGLLSIVGKLIEDPTLNRAQIDSAGNLYARMLIEDPMLSKVDWGPDGIVRCRAFWEGGLWTPSSIPIYYLYACFKNQFAKINPIDLSVIETLNLTSDTLGIVSMNKEGNYIYGVLMSIQYFKTLIQIQINPLNFIGRISLTDPYGSNFLNLILDQSYFHIQDNAPYLLKYDRSNNQLLNTAGRFQYSDGWFYRGSFFYLIGQFNAIYFKVTKTNYVNSYAIYYDGNTYPQYRNIKWADMLNGFIYILTAYSLIKIDCKDNQAIDPVISKLISHNLSIFNPTAGGTPTNAIILARSDYLYIIYKNTSRQLHVKLYDHEFNYVRGAQFASGDLNINLVADDNEYLYILLVNNAIYKIKKSDLSIAKTNQLPFSAEAYNWQNSFIIF